MIDFVYDYLIEKTNSIATSFSENIGTDAPSVCAVYRLVGGSRSKTLSRTRYNVRINHAKKA